MTLSRFSPDFFRDPPAIYRPLQIIHGMDRLVNLDEQHPAGSGWPASPDTSKLDSYLEKLVTLGAGGIVTNVSFDQYLTDPDQWDLLRYGIKKAISLGMRVWIYDEKGYPSGTAGGFVNRANPEYNALGLACYTIQANQEQEICFPLPVSCKKFVWAGAAPDFESVQRDQVIDLSRNVDEWQVLHWNAPKGHWQVIYLAERIMYEGTHASRNVSDFKQYVNLLDPQAVLAFIRVTHESYKRELGPELWSHIDAVFTDEPSLMSQYLPELPERYIGRIPVLDGLVFEDRPPAVPWTGDFLEIFKAQKGYDLRGSLYALFYSETAEACRIRMDFYEVVTGLYSTAFFQQIRDWCNLNKVESSGHVLLEESLLDHPAYEGSLLSVLKQMDLPGIDMLNSRPQEMLHDSSYMGASFMAIKQASSAAHLAGRMRVHSESSDWVQQNSGQVATLDERLGQTNLQYVLGINLITSYFGWQEIGEAVCKVYHDYAARLGAYLTGGSHVCDVAVLYPIRTAWAHFKPPQQPMTNWAVRPVQSRWMELANLTYPRTVYDLLTHQFDLDIVDDESLESGAIYDGRLLIGSEAYRVVVLPPVHTLSATTLKRLLSLAEAGGWVFFQEEIPSLVRSEDETGEFELVMNQLIRNEHCVVIPASVQVSDEMSKKIDRDFELGRPDRDILYTHRWLEGREIYFVVNCAPDPKIINPRLREAGPYQLYRPRTADISELVDWPEIPLGAYEGIFLIRPSR